MLAAESCEHRDLLLGLTREPDVGYGDSWHSQTGLSKFISVKTYLAHSDSWPYTPSVKRYREVPDGDRRRVASAFSETLASALAKARQPVVICIETPYLEGFVDAMRGRMDVPFVLVSVMGGDAPFTREMQDQVLGLEHLQACFAQNLHAAGGGGLGGGGGVFHPLPLGLPGEEAPLRRVRSKILPWGERDRRLLLAPMRSTSRLRKRYLQVLSGEEYQEIVRIEAGPLDLEAFLALLGEHRSVLSPPGRGYDCFRTWQILAVGSVPLVVDDPMFDQRIHQNCGAEYIPPVDELSPRILTEVLAQLQDPARFADQLDVTHWKSVWRSYLDQ